MTPIHLLIGVALFQFKHFIADFTLQWKYTVANKGRYGHPAGILHAGLHMLASVPVLIVLGVPGLGIAVTVLVEGMIHYHIDWSKERIQSRLGLTITQWRFWVLFGLDQFIHQITYLVILWVWAV